jgi:hypothetical protein
MRGQSISSKSAKRFCVGYAVKTKGWSASYLIEQEQKSVRRTDFPA